MIRRNLSPSTRRFKLSGAIAAGTGDTQTLTEIDTRGFESVVITVILGVMAANAVAQLTAKLSNTSGSYGAGTVDALVDNNGSVVTVSATGAGDQNKVLTLEIFRPQRRYVRAQIQRLTANTTIDAVFVELYRPQNTVLTPASADGYGAIAQGNNISSS